MRVFRVIVSEYDLGLEWLYENPFHFLLFSSDGTPRGSRRNEVMRGLLITTLIAS